MAHRHDLMPLQGADKSSTASPTTLLPAANLDVSCQREQGYKAERHQLSWVWESAGWVGLDTAGSWDSFRSLVFACRWVFGRCESK